MLLHHPLADVGCHLDHAGDLALLVQYRHVAGFQPDFAAGLVDALEGTADGLALPQFTPQLLVFGTFCVARVAEQPVVLAAQLLGAVAHGLAEALIGIEDRAVGGELDHCHGAADRRQLGLQAGQGLMTALDLDQIGLAVEIEHDAGLLYARFPEHRSPLTPCKHSAITL
ncbi:hypothetical protein D3C79_710630 [compost metagenome]